MMMRMKAINDERRAQLGDFKLSFKAVKIVRITQFENEHGVWVSEWYTTDDVCQADEDELAIRVDCKDPIYLHRGQLYVPAIAGGYFYCPPVSLA